MLTQLEKEWGGKIILNPGTTHSKGTAILFNTNKYTECLNYHKSEDGRIILINIKIEDKTICLINTYAPNNPNERKSFFLKLNKWISRFAHNKEEIILGGDMNYTEPNKIDRKDKENTKDVSTNAYKTLLENHSLHDIWREMHPDKIQFTYLEKSRLDKFLISNECMNYTQNTHIFHAGIKTDHKCISMSLNFSPNKKGPGRWKLNTSILNDNTYIRQIKELIKSTSQEYNFLCKQMQWEICKIKIRENSIIYCKKRQAVKRNIMKEIEQKLKEKEEELINSNYNHKIILEKDILLQKLHEHVEEKSMGAKIRSRAKWFEQGEKSTKYFYSLEKKNYSDNTIKQLKTENGTNVTSNKEILQEQFAYYKKLYQENSIPDENIANYLDKVKITNSLNDNEALLLEGEITEQECLFAIKNMKTNKSPGSDGIPAEFYASFWTDIKHLLLGSLNAAYQKGELSPTQKRGILNLIFKKNDKTLLSNWRPITLLNTDYKILAHVLANRLKKVIPKLVNTDQSGYIKGRNICYNIRLIQDVIDYFEENNKECAVVFVDFQKAFDTVSHNFLSQVLTKFNFGESFKKWVNVIYTNAESCTTNNGWTSKPFHVKKGIRQGCPLSALLFLLVVEILAVKIRENTQWGLNIDINGNKNVIQISQLADDTTLFFESEEAIKHGLKIIEDFGEVSGLKLNKEKTEGLWLGRGTNRKDNFAGINWQKNTVKALGVHFGYDKKQTELLNWEEKIAKIKACLKCWNSRDLSLQGRVQVIKTLALAKVVYLCASIHVPEWVIKEINKEFFTFFMEI